MSATLHDPDVTSSSTEEEAAETLQKSNGSNTDIDHEDIEFAAGCGKFETLVDSLAPSPPTSPRSRPRRNTKHPNSLATSADACTTTSTDDTTSEQCSVPPAATSTTSSSISSTTTTTTTPTPTPTPSMSAETEGAIKVIRIEAVAPNVYNPSAVPRKSILKPSKAASATAAAAAATTTTTTSTSKSKRSTVVSASAPAILDPSTSGTIVHKKRVKFAEDYTVTEIWQFKRWNFKSPQPRQSSLLETLVTMFRKL
jgi:hypothetical protein